MIKQNHVEIKNLKLKIEELTRENQEIKDSNIYHCMRERDKLIEDNKNLRDELRDLTRSMIKLIEIKTENQNLILENKNLRDKLNEYTQTN